MRSRPTIEKILFLAICLFGVVLLSLIPLVEQPVFGQFPTVSIPTVTSSPRGAYVVGMQVGTSEYEPVNIRNCPSTICDIVGVLLVRQEAKAIGQYADWIQIEYIGGVDGKAWVYHPFVNLIDGPVPMVEPPPTPTPMVTKTIDPTLAAQFIAPLQSTKLPTFTEPQPLLIPTFPEQTGATIPGGIPLGLVIVILAGLGLFLTLIAILRRG